MAVEATIDLGNFQYYQKKLQLMYIVTIFIEDINLFIFCSKISQQRTPGNRNNALGKREKKRREEV